ncbi:MAG: amino acid adenylation domain-containing protein [Deltaproteobacteria bacterium]|nr:amino acid adenylation domain-containing protein [Deltaproteobacteria bacterium]
MQPYLLHQLLTESSRIHAERPAVIQGANFLTYAELDRQSDQLASCLAGLGVAPGDRVGILLHKAPEAVVAIYGILKLGGIYVPLDHLAPPARLAGILDRCDITALITSSSLAGKILAEPLAAARLRSLILASGEPFSSEGKVCRSWNDVMAAPSLPPETGPTADGRPAYILHTSGSTGIPKGVVISHLNALTFVRMAADFFAISSEDRLASHAPFHFDLSVFDLFTAAARGAAVVLVPETLGIFPPRLAEFIDRERITVWNSVASVIALLAEHGRLERCAFDPLRLVLFSGDVLSAKHLRKAMERMPKTAFYNLYGQTEANSSTFHRVNSLPADDRWKIPIGRPFPNFEVHVLDDHNQPVRESGATGELYVGGATVALGYWRDPEKTSASFVENGLHPWPGRLYRTGDLVRFNEQGELVFLGRRDRQIKSRGYRIMIDEIDLTLLSHPQVREAAAVDIPDELLGARILGFVHGAAEITEAELLDFCSQCLPPYMVPERIIFVANFPRTATGKIDRRSLRETAGGESRSAPKDAFQPQ